jgi:hypothetical protein
MNNQTFKLLLTSIICFTLLIGTTIGANILTSQHTKELIKFALEKGQNPIYVKCAMESNSSSSSNECKTMMTVIAVSKSDK